VVDWLGLFEETFFLIGLSDQQNKKKKKMHSFGRLVRVMSTNAM
jgi:hypothetical protein